MTGVIHFFRIKHEQIFQLTLKCLKQWLLHHQSGSVDNVITPLSSSSKQRRNRHVRIQHQGLKVKCTVEGCEYQVWHHSEVCQHWDRVHQSDGEKIGCDQCTYKAGSLRVLKCHVRDIHIQDKKKLWPCSDCRKELRSAWNLKDHIKFFTHKI